MEQIPTVEEMINKHTISNPKENWERNGKSEITDYKAAMIEFAKLHVEAALKAAVKHLPYDDKMNQSLLDERAILNSYPIDNIK